jgi:FkbM family methyltransferase
MENITCSLSENRDVLTFYNNSGENFFSNFTVYDNVYNLVVVNGWISVPAYGYTNFVMGNILDDASKITEYKGVRIYLPNENGETKEYSIGDNSSEEHFFHHNNSAGLSEWVNWKKNNVYKETFFDSDVVYDLGANIGLYSRWALDQGISQCFSFEPHPDVFPKLVKNLKKFTNVECFNIAISDRNGYSDFGLSIYDVGSSFNYQDNVKEWISIETINLEDWIVKNNHAPPTIIKCDIEQEEFKFLDSLSDNFIKSLRYIVVEFHLYTEEKNELFKYIIRFLDLGFSCRDIPNIHNSSTHKTLKFVNVNYK